MRQSTAPPVDGPGCAQKWQCVLCDTSVTPMKRNHPVHGPKTLCNACGVRLSRRTKIEKSPKCVERFGAPSARMDSTPPKGARRTARQAKPRCSDDKSPLLLRSDRKRAGAGVECDERRSLEPVPALKQHRHCDDDCATSTVQVQTPAARAAPAAISTRRYALDADDTHWLAAFNAAHPSPTPSDASSSSCTPLAGGGDAAPVAITPAQLAALLQALDAAFPNGTPASTHHVWECLESVPGCPPLATTRPVFLHWLRKRSAAPAAAPEWRTGLSAADLLCSNPSQPASRLLGVQQPESPSSQSEAQPRTPCTPSGMRAADFSCLMTSPFDENTNARESILGASLVVPRLDGGSSPASGSTTPFAPPSVAPGPGSPDTPFGDIPPLDMSPSFDIGGNWPPDNSFIECDLPSDKRWEQVRERFGPGALTPRFFTLLTPRNGEAPCSGGATPRGVAEPPPLPRNAVLAAACAGADAERPLLALLSQPSRNAAPLSLVLKAEGAAVGEWPTPRNGSSKLAADSATLLQQLGWDEGEDASPVPQALVTAPRSGGQRAAARQTLPLLPLLSESSRSLAASMELACSTFR